MKGTFIISIDFEIHWGVLDTKSIKNYGANLRGVRQAISGMLELFDKYDINATFATVGMLFYKDKSSLLGSLPDRKPGYQSEQLNPYKNIETLVGESEENDPYHYGRSVIQLIQQKGRHEIGSHTFSHFYCLEKGQTIFEFEADLAAFRKAADSLGVAPQSLVFPRNQLRYNYLRSLVKFGYTCYRGNEDYWVYEPHIKQHENLTRRGIRFLDAYFNLTGNHIYSEQELTSSYPFNLKASRFLRPYRPYFALLEPFKLRRIKNSMKAAAVSGKMYHLWWHPHNFGVNTAENLKSLENILKTYRKLHETHGLENYTMSEYSQHLKKKYHATS